MAKRIKKPTKDSVRAGKQFTYLNCPKNMDSCFYELELKELKETEQGDKLVFVFNVISTDTKEREGTEISHLLDPFQKFAETYFWREVFGLCITLSGKEIEQERIDKLRKRLNKIECESIAEIIEFAEANGCEVGRCARAKFKRFNKDGKDKTRLDWEPMTDDEESDEDD